MVGSDYEEDLRLIVNGGVSEHLTGHLDNVLCF